MGAQQCRQWDRRPTEEGLVVQATSFCYPMSTEVFSRIWENPGLWLIHLAPIVRSQQKALSLSSPTFRSFPRSDSSEFREKNFRDRGSFPPSLENSFPASLCFFGPYYEVSCLRVMVTQRKMPELMNTQSTSRCSNRRVRELDITATKSLEMVLINIFSKTLDWKAEKQRNPYLMAAVN